MTLAPPIASLLRGARGLSGRAVAFALGLVLLSSILSTALVLFGLLWNGHIAPVLIALAGALAAALLVTAHYVRGAAAPLEALTQHAERIANGDGGRIELRTGDEIETLAVAFNAMSARLDASMRRIQEIAFIDPITQLPNYDRFEREVGVGLAGARDGRTVSVVAVLVLRRLPRLLQTLEAEAARDLARVFGMRFEAALGAAAARVGARTPVLGARLSRDEFALFASGVAAAEALQMTQQVAAAVNQPFEWRGHQVSMGVCSGVALSPRDGCDAEVLIRRARIAIATENGATGVNVFSPALDREAAARVSMEREMRGALERNEFRAYFQPKLSLATGRIEGCEALARWVRADRTIIGPDRFIPAAEESGLITALSDAILREACWKAAAWARAGHPAKVAVNVSALQFQNDRFAESVLNTIQHAGLPGSHLELEVTETVAMGDPDRTARIISPLREAGVRLAIDDFGCGYSSLAALSRLPFDVIKVDRQFVRALERGEKHAGAIIDMILALARTLNMEVVAEGVERRAEAEFMAARGCHWAQGFLYGAAVAAPEFAELLRRQAEEDRAANAA